MIFGGKTKAPSLFEDETGGINTENLVLKNRFIDLIVLL